MNNIICVLSVVNAINGKMSMIGKALLMVYHYAVNYSKIRTACNEVSRLQQNKN